MPNSSNATANVQMTEMLVGVNGSAVRVRRTIDGRWWIENTPALIPATLDWEDSETALAAATELVRLLEAQREREAEHSRTLQAWAAKWGGIDA